jgi:hypothetical protein
VIAGKSISRSGPSRRASRPLRNRRSYFLPFPFFEIQIEKALGHTLHPAVVMALVPTTLCRVKLQNPVLGGAVVPLAHIAKLNEPASAARPIAQGSGAEAD